MKIALNKLILFSFVFIIFSCKAQKKEDYTIVPFHINIDSINQYSLSKALELAPLNSDFNGSQVRIWRENSFGNTAWVAALTDSASNKTAELIVFKYIYNKALDSVTSLSISKKECIPASGWNTFTSKFKSFDIPYLPGYRSHSNYDLPMDADGILVEFNSKKQYRSYHYPQPDVNQNIPAAKKLVQAMNYIEDQFGFEGFGYSDVQKSN